MNRFSEIRDLVMGLEGDFQKFYDKENKAAGTRVRKGMQELKNLAQDVRMHVQGMKNSDGKPAKKGAAKKTAKKK
ncbi:MAG: histone H1 [Bacteroidetes bacterium]|nr:histone H1 [Bacteroidota bacterium]